MHQLLLDARRVPLFHGAPSLNDIQPEETMFHTTRTFRELNIEQRHALRTRGFLLINAVAGSGKTTMLVALLLKSLMEDRDGDGNPIRLDRFAVITFTRKAAANLRARIRKAMEAERDETADPMWRTFWEGHLRDLPAAAIGTIDSLVQDRLRRMAVAGSTRFDPSIEVLDDVGREILAEKAVRRVMELAADQPKTELGQALECLGGEYQAKDLRGRFLDLMAKDGDGSTAARTINLLTDGQGGYEKLEAMLANQPRDEWTRIWFPLAEGFHGRLGNAVAELAGRTTKAVLEIQKLQAGWNPADATSPENFAELRNALFNNEGEPRRQGLAGRDGVCYSESLATLQADILPAIDPFDHMVYQTNERIFAENAKFPVYRAWGVFFEAAHRAYLEECRAENRFSFHDLARLFELELENLSPEQLGAAGLPFTRVMIDEFQDNTSLQWRIGCRIAGGHAEDPSTWSGLTVVGDPEQAIYHWRGSNAQLMADVRRQYEASNPTGLPTWYDTIRHEVEPAGNDRPSTAAEQIGVGQLALNFRTRATTLDRIDRCSETAMRALGIPHVSLLSGEELRALAGRPNTVPALAEMLVLPEQPGGTNAIDDDAPETEGEPEDKGYDPASLRAVASRLHQLRDENGLLWRDMLVLARGFTKLIDPLHEAFREAGIPYRAMVREAIWTRQEVRDVLNLARYLANADDGPALLGILRGPACRLTDSEIMLLASWRERGTPQQGLAMIGDPARAPDNAPALEAWNQLGADRVEHLRSVAARLASWRRLVDRMPHHELLRMALDESGAFMAMAAWLAPGGTGAEAARRVASGIEFVLDRVREIEQARAITMADMADILDRHASGEIREGIEPDLSADEDMVRVMSIHASKGLEAKAVVLLVPEVGKKPHRPRGSGMIVVDRQYLRPEITFEQAAPYIGLPLMDLRGSHERDDRNPPPSLYRIARGTDNGHYEREEARLFHVAMTRSEGTLIVAAPRITNEGDSRHWPIVWSRDHLTHVDAAALPPATGKETPFRPAPAPTRPPAAAPARVAVAATRLQDIMDLKTRQEQVEALRLVRRGLQSFPAGVPNGWIDGDKPRTELGKVVGTLAHRGIEMIDALPADKNEQLRYLAGQARQLLSESFDDEEPGEGSRVAGEAGKVAESSAAIIARLGEPTHEAVRRLMALPGAAEVDFALPVGNQWLVTGRFDRLLDNGDVIDWKTDRGDPREIRDRYRGQMGLYALAVSEARRLRGEGESGVFVKLALLSTGDVINLEYTPAEIASSRLVLEQFLTIS